MTGEHSAFAELCRRFRYARQLWHNNPLVQEVAVTIGMSEWEYCQRIVATMGPILWSGTSTTLAVGLTDAHAQSAFRDAEVEAQ